MDKQQKKLIAMGGSCVDLFFKMDRLPQVGETLDSQGFERSFGGKGANATLQCGKIGVDVQMLTLLGDDEAGKRFIEIYNSFGVGTQNAKLLQGYDTSQGYILTLPNGSCSIFMNFTTNKYFTPEMKELDPEWTKAIQSADLLLLQREVPEYINTIAAKIAKEAGATVVLDVGGKNEPMTEEFIRNIDVISPNETELERVIGKKYDTMEQAKIEIEEFIRKYPHIKFLFKKGEKGSAIYWMEGDIVQEIDVPAFKFEDYPPLRLVDTAGAGDCFTGAFACKYMQGAPLKECLEFGNKAGFLCCSKKGTYTSIPSLKDIQEIFGE